MPARDEAAEIKQSVAARRRPHAPAAGVQPASGDAVRGCLRSATSSRGMDTMLRRLIGPEIEFEVRRPRRAGDRCRRSRPDRAGGAQPGRQRPGCDAEGGGRLTVSVDDSRIGRDRRGRPRRRSRRPVRAPERQRHGHGHRRGHAGAALRTVLHHQGARQGTGSASRSSTASCNRAAATCTWRASQGTARHSPFICRWPRAAFPSRLGCVVVAPAFGQRLSRSC